MTATLSDNAERFLRRFRAGLSAIPQPDRDEIVNEIRAHLMERHGQGKADLLEGFGKPEEYAARFLSEYALIGAIAKGTSFDLGRAILIGARRSFLALFVVLPLWVLQTIGAILVVLGLLKPFFFDLIGLFRVNGEIRGLGIYNGSGEEILGWWAVPLFVIPGLVIAWSCNQLLRAIARRRLGASHAAT